MQPPLRVLCTAPLEELPTALTNDAVHRPSKGAAYSPFCDTLNVTMKTAGCLPLAKQEEQEIADQCSDAVIKCVVKV